MAETAVSLYLPGPLHAAMQAQAAALPQEEVCGLLGGMDGYARLVLPVENILHRADSFRMEPQAQVGALFALEQAGLTLLAIYHSHPAGPGVPSQRDEEEFAYPGVLTLIWSPDPAGDWQMRAFELRQNGFSEVAWQIEACGGCA